MDKLERLSKAQLIRMVNQRFCAPSDLYPNGLIGQKVRYTQNAVKKGIDKDFPLPECGYFTIASAHLAKHGVILVNLNEGMYATWNISVNFLEPFNENF